MKLPRSLTTVTLLSKLIALILFVSLPFIGFYLGYKYRSSIIFTETPNPVNSSATDFSQEQISQIKRLEDVIARCGDAPIIEPYRISISSQTQLGAGWAPNCRNIAWSSTRSNLAVGWYSDEDYQETTITPPPFKPEKFEGIFVYNICSQKIDRIYTPDTEDGFYFDKWLDNVSFLYHTPNQAYVYNLLDNSSQLYSE